MMPWALEWELLLAPLFIPGRVAIDNTTRRVPQDLEDPGESEVLSRESVYSEALEDGAVLRDFEDRRTWRPSGLSEGARTFRGRFSGLRPKTSRFVDRVPFGLAFDNPRLVLVCARRAARRQVMFARGYRGRLGFKRSRRSRFSGISCEVAYG